jgi:uncharacterized membrane protein
MPLPQRAAFTAAAAAATAPADASAVSWSFSRACLSAAAIIFTVSSFWRALSLQLQLVLLLLVLSSLPGVMLVMLLDTQMLQRLVASDASSLRMTAAAGSDCLQDQTC